MKRPVWVLSCLAVVLCLARLRTYDEPLERDITTYAVIGHELLGGRSLYADLWDHKPPAVHVAYAGAELVAGYGPRAVYLLNVTASIATLLAVYAAGAGGAGGAAAGLVAAGLWTIVSGDLRLEANQPNTEVFVNACLAWAFALLVRARSRRRVLGAGALFALATLFKHVALAPVALVAAAWWLAPDPDESRRTRARDVAVLAGVGAAAWGLVLLYFAARGHLAAFWEAVFVFNRALAGSLGRNLADGCRELLGGHSPLLAVAPAAALALAGAPASVRSGARRWLLLGAWMLGAAAASWLPGRPLDAFFPHYYQLWMPPIVVAAGWSAAGLARWRARGLVVASAFALALFVQAPRYALSPDEWSTRKYGPIFVESKALGEKLGGELPEGYRFYDWGTETGLYFYSRRSPPVGVFYVAPVYVPPVGARLLTRIRDGLDRARPEVIVLGGSWPPPPEVSAWVKASYAPVTRIPGTIGFELWARR